MSARERVNLATVLEQLRTEYDALQERSEERRTQVQIRELQKQKQQPHSPYELREAVLDKIEPLLPDPGEEREYFSMTLSKDSDAMSIDPWPLGNLFAISEPTSFTEFQDVFPGIAKKLVAEKPLLVVAQEDFREEFGLTSLYVPDDAMQDKLQRIKRELVDPLVAETAQTNTRIELANKEIDARLLELAATHRAQQEQFQTKKGTLEDHMRYVTRSVNLQDAVPAVSKQHHILDSKPFYSLWLKDSPAFLLLANQLVYLHTTKKDKPLELKQLPLDSILSAHEKELSQEYHGIDDGAFYDGHGYKLTDAQAKVASNIFEHVFTGKEILPAPETPAGYVIRQRKVRDDETKPRHWGQLHLAQKKPERVVLGKLLGSGTSYKAYVFGEKTIVEADEEERATYVFDTSHFENLRTWQRSRLLEAQPAGFTGRIFHDNKDAWKQEIEHVLGYKAVQG